MLDLVKIQQHYRLGELHFVNHLSNGLIHQTYVLHNSREKFILQFFNQNIFENEKIIANNYWKVIEHLKHQQKYHYEKLIFIKNNQGKLFSRYDDQIFRIAAYIEHDPALDMLNGDACEQLGRCLGEFHSALNSDCLLLDEPIDNFLNFDLRVFNFRKSLQHGNINRIEENQELLQWFIQEAEVIQDWKLHLQQYSRRVIHGDPKSSNFLFENNKVKALIDWDTIMPGYIQYDIGDLLRSCVSSNKENSSGVEFNSENFESVIRGYKSTQIYNTLSTYEKENLAFSALPVIYVQALRFFTDYLMNDRYYTISYPEENIDKSKNQLELYNQVKAFLKDR